MINNRHFCEPIFQIDLHFHQSRLKLNDHFFSELAHIDHSSSLVEQTGSFRNNQYFETSIS